MITSSSDIMQTLRGRMDNPLYNTSYPLSPEDWRRFEVDGELSFDIDRPIAFYVHIPFCRRLCRFCEYSRVLAPSAEDQATYIRILGKDIARFMSNYPNLQLYGFDIGGGTPTALDEQAFVMLLNLYQDVIALVNLTTDYQPSIEATFETLSARKIEMIAEAGIHRLSLGVQSSSKSILTPLNRRTEEIGKMSRAIELAHKAGIKIVNLDLMYGLPGQTLESIRDDIQIIKSLRPEQVTVYEYRTNQLKTTYKVDNQLSYSQYSRLFEELTGIGYYSRFGQNTFSVNASDYGVSSYLRHRMLDGWQYKGFGLSAQSMTDAGLSYNLGKGEIRKAQITESQTAESFRHYSLPPAEVLAKYIAISGYSGGFSLAAARRLFGQRFDARYGEVLATLKREKLVNVSDDRVQITREGYRHYGAILSMFYP